MGNDDDDENENENDTSQNNQENQWKQLNSYYLITFF